MAAKNLESSFVKCIDCKHAKFMQWYENPIIAECLLHKDRQVALAKRLCPMFTRSNADPEIQHFDSYDQSSS